MKATISTERHYSDFLVGNKRVTPADIKFIEKYIVPKMKHASGSVRNPMTDNEFETNPLIETLIKFVQELIYSDFSVYTLKEWGVPSGQKIQLFDRARYLILKLDNNIYMNVID
jgi:hypothetical protein